MLLRRIEPLDLTAVDGGGIVETESVEDGTEDVEDGGTEGETFETEGVTFGLVEDGN